MVLIEERRKSNRKYLDCKKCLRMIILAISMMVFIVLSTVGAECSESKSSTLVQYPSSMRLNRKGTVVLGKGKTCQLKTVITPSKVKNGRITWSSNNTKIATVNSKGLVTAVGYGMARVTAKTANGKKAVCNFFVGVKEPSSVQVDKSSVTMVRGERFRMAVKISPEYVLEKQITFKSSNISVATVDSRGKVDAVGYGTATIYAKTVNGKKAKVRVKVGSYRFRETDPRVIVCATGDTIRKYRMYNEQKLGGYYLSHGCVGSATAIIATGFGKTCTPVSIHTGSVNTPGSERHAIQKLGLSSALYNSAAISLRTSAQILEDMGIKARPVYVFDTAKAIKEITKHINSGKPVLVKAHNRVVDGIRLANGHHAWVLVGIDEKGYGIFIDPMYGKLNINRQGGEFHITIADFVKKYMYNCSGNYKSAYITNLGAGGGYILVG